MIKEGIMINKQKFVQRFTERLQKRLGTFTTEVMVHPTPEDREKAFIEWAKKNPQAFDFKAIKLWEAKVTLATIAERELCGDCRKSVRNVKNF